MPIDYSKYPENWKSEIRPRILKRANNCCEFCGLANYSRGIRTLKDGGLVSLDEYMTDCASNPWEIIKAKYGEYHELLRITTIILTVAHLDHDETNHDVKDERLRALCQRCHLRYDRKEKMKRKAEKKYKNSLFPYIRSSEQHST